MSAKSDKVTEPLPEFDKMWDFDHPDQTEAKFKELLPDARTSSDRSYYAELLTQIARSQGLQRNFDEAHKTLDIVEKMLADDLVKTRIRYLLERGRVFNSSGFKDKAKPLFLTAFELAEAKGEDYYAIDAIHMLQIVEPPEKQLDWAEKAIGMAEKSNDERARKWLGPLYNNTGWAYFDLKQLDKAMVLFEKSLLWRREQNDEPGTRIALWTIARTHRERGNTEKALEMQNKIEEELEQKGLGADGYVLEEIGECLLLLDKKDDSKVYFKRAFEVLSADEWLKANEPDRLKRLKELSE